jgi:hypothetical protein
MWLQYSGAMGSNDDIREQTALDVVHFLEKELTDEVGVCVCALCASCVVCHDAPAAFFKA